MECLYCSTQLPDKGYYCPSCSKQYKCKSCQEILLKNAVVCVFCGIEPNSTANSTNMNTIEFSETKNSRMFKANFTDTVGQSISDSFGMLLANKIAKKTAVLQTNGKFLPDSIQPETEDAEVLEESDTPEIVQVKKIFKSDGEKTTLSETRLKASSKRDYGIRLSIIFLYYKSLLGIDNVPRKELTAILNHASVEDGNLRYWLTNNPLIGINDDLVELKAPGRDAAKKYLSEITNSELKDKWQIGTHSKVGRRQKEKTTKNDGHL